MTESPGSATTRIASRTTTHLQLALLAAVTLGTRLFAIWKTEILILGWRPVDLASIALNYYRNGLDLLYPQIFWGGAGPGFVEMELPLIPFLTALLYRVFGLHDGVTLIIPLLSGIGVVFVTYAIARYLYGSTVGLMAGVFVALSPTMIGLTVSLWPDPPMIFCGGLGIYFLLRWVDSNRLRDFVLGACAASVSILLKITALYIGLPILFLCIYKYRRAWWRTPLVWWLGAIILVPPGLWYWHAHSLYVNYHNTFGIVSAGYLKFATAGILSDPAFYGHVSFRLAMYHVGPLAFVALLYGFFLRQPNGLGYVFHIWIGAVVLYLLVAARGVLIGHYQYMLPIVPAAAPLAAFASVSIFRRFSPVLSLRTTRPVTRLLAGAGWIVLLVTFLGANLLYASQGIYSIAYWENDRKTGLVVGQKTPSGSLIIVVDNQMDEYTPERSMTPPHVFYFADRKGWYQSMAWLNPQLVESMRKDGAKYLVVTGNALANFNSPATEIREYLSAHFGTVFNTADGTIYDLNTRQAQSEH